MKNILPLIIFVFLFIGCCDPGGEPSPPYGAADDISRYEGSDGYKSIDYTYYCKGGKYISVTYIRKDACSDYNKDSEYSSSGICSAAILSSMKLNGLSSKKKINTLIQYGYKIDTIIVSHNSTSHIISP